MLFEPSHMAMATSLLDQKSHLLANQQSQSQTSSRILYDIPCKVCSDHSSGKHYGIFACDGCAGFFKRSIRRNRQYVCKAKTEGACLVDKTHRNQCRACRLKRCLDVGMNKEAVQHERGPRNSTLRRQMSLYFKEAAASAAASSATPPSASSLESTPPPPPITSAAPVFPSLLPSPPISASHYSPPPPPHPLSLRAPKPFFVDPRILSVAAYHHLLPPSPPVPASAPAPVSPPSMPPFSLPLPTTIPQENISETAARLLFMNVRWAQNIPAFTSLPYRDQLTLLEETWRELFVLSSAQFALPVELASLSSLDDLNVLNELKAFQETIQKFQAMSVDPTEFACLRAIVLLKANLEGNGDVKKELRDQVSINALQDQAQLTLSQYIAKTYPNQPQRFGKLLLLLPSLKSVTGKTIHSVFFKCIGNIPLEKLICDMFKAQGI